MNSSAPTPLTLNHTSIKRLLDECDIEHVDITDSSPHFQLTKLKALLFFHWKDGWTLVWNTKITHPQDEEELAEELAHITVVHEAYERSLELVAHHSKKFPH